MMIKSFVSMTATILINGYAFGDQPVTQQISITYVNGGITSGVTNLVAAESMLRDEGKKICGTDATDIAVKNLEFKIEGCGHFDLMAEACYPATAICNQPITYFRCYPKVVANAEIACLAGTND